MNMLNKKTVDDIQVKDKRVLRLQCTYEGRRDYG